MKWLFLAVAIGAEVLATASLRAVSATGASSWWWALVVGGYMSAFALLFGALSAGAPLAAAYAIWAGAGVALTAAVAWRVFGEPLSVGSMAGIALIVVGVILVETSSGHTDPS